jgi:hypothetical protein
MHITQRGNGLFGHGMDQFIQDDLELGERVAIGLDSEQCWGASASLMFLTVEDAA